MGRGCRRAWGTAPQAPAASELSRLWACLCPLRAGLWQAADTGSQCTAAVPAGGASRGCGPEWTDTGTQAAGQQACCSRLRQGVSEEATH